MKVVLSLALCEKQGYAGRRVLLLMDAEWDAIPPEHAWFSYGTTEDGEGGAITASRLRVGWQSDSVVSVQAESENLHDEFDHAIELAKRDGFLEYEEYVAKREAADKGLSWAPTRPK